MGLLSRPESNRKDEDRLMKAFVVMHAKIERLRSSSSKIFVELSE